MCVQLFFLFQGLFKAFWWFVQCVFSQDCSVLCCSKVLSRFVGCVFPMFFNVCSMIFECFFVMAFSRICQGVLPYPVRHGATLGFSGCLKIVSHHDLLKAAPWRAGWGRTPWKPLEKTLRKHWKIIECYVEKTTTQMKSHWNKIEINWKHIEKH